MWFSAHASFNTTTILSAVGDLIHLVYQKKTEASGGKKNINQGT